MQTLGNSFRRSTLDGTLKFHHVFCRSGKKPLDQAAQSSCSKRFSSNDFDTGLVHQKDGDKDEQSSTSENQKYTHKADTSSTPSSPSLLSMLPRFVPEKWGEDAADDPLPRFDASSSSGNFFGKKTTYQSIHNASVAFEGEYRLESDTDAPSSKFNRRFGSRLKRKCILDNLFMKIPTTTLNQDLSDPLLSHRNDVWLMQLFEGVCQLVQPNISDANRDDVYVDVLWQSLALASLLPEVALKFTTFFPLWQKLCVDKKLLDSNRFSEPTWTEDQKSRAYIKSHAKLFLNLRMVSHFLTDKSYIREALSPKFVGYVTGSMATNHRHFLWRQENSDINVWDILRSTAGFKLDSNTHAHPDFLRRLYELILSYAHVLPLTSFHLHLFRERTKPAEGVESIDVSELFDILERRLLAETPNWFDTFGNNLSTNYWSQLIKIMCVLRGIKPSTQFWERFVAFFDEDKIEKLDTLGFVGMDTVSLLRGFVIFDVDISKDCLKRIVDHLVLTKLGSSSSDTSYQPRTELLPPIFAQFLAHYSKRMNIDESILPVEARKNLFHTVYQHLTVAPEDLKNNISAERKQINSNHQTLRAWDFLWYWSELKLESDKIITQKFWEAFIPHAIDYAPHIFSDNDASIRIRGINFFSRDNEAEVFRRLLLAPIRLGYEPTPEWNAAMEQCILNMYSFNWETNPTPTVLQTLEELKHLTQAKLLPDPHFLRQLFAKWAENILSQLNQQTTPPEEVAADLMQWWQRMDMDCVISESESSDGDAGHRLASDTLESLLVSHHAAQALPFLNILVRTGSLSETEIHGLLKKWCSSQRSQKLTSHSVGTQEIVELCKLMASMPADYRPDNELVDEVLEKAKEVSVDNSVSFNDLLTIWLSIASWTFVSDPRIMEINISVRKSLERRLDKVSDLDAWNFLRSSIELGIILPKKLLVSAVDGLLGKLDAQDTCELLKCLLMQKTRMGQLQYGVELDDVILDVFEQVSLLRQDLSAEDRRTIQMTKTLLGYSAVPYELLCLLSEEEWLQSLNPAHQSEDNFHIISPSLSQSVQSKLESGKFEAMEDDIVMFVTQHTVNPSLAKLKNVVTQLGVPIRLDYDVFLPDAGITVDVMARKLKDHESSDSAGRFETEFNVAAENSANLDFCSSTSPLYLFVQDWKRTGTQTQTKRFKPVDPELKLRTEVARKAGLAVAEIDDYVSSETYTKLRSHFLP